MSISSEQRKSEPNRPMVFLRIRPFSAGEQTEGAKHLFEGLEFGDGNSCTVDTKPYTFDKIFDGPNMTQEDLYVTTTKPVIDSVFKGYWGTVMMYGQTGTGKSYTMCNFAPRHEGVIPRAMRQIFDNVSQDPTRTYTVCFSFIQIYCDKLQDMFNPEGLELKINRDKNGVSFPGIKEHVVRDVDHFRELYEDGHQHRVITATKISPESSRGHVALFIQIKSVPRHDPGGDNRSGKLFLIDLAGYERFSKTGVQEGKMAHEARTINASLLALGNVVSGLAAGSGHIPWRDSKLTRLLEDAIGGKAKCSIILTASPSNEHLHETLSTLYFGSRAIIVPLTLTDTSTPNYERLAKELAKQLKESTNKVSALEIEATRRQLEREEVEARFREENARLRRRQEDQLQSLLASGASPDKIRQFIASNQREDDLLEEQHYVERTNMEERHEAENLESIRQQESASTTIASNKELAVLRRMLEKQSAESSRWQGRATEAERELHKLTAELNESKVLLLARANEMDPTNATASIDGQEKRRLVDSKIDSIRAMLEENYSLKLQAVEEPLREDNHRLQLINNDLQNKFVDDLQNQKDVLTAVYETEITEIRKTSQEVQERLKKNHLTIKRSYQKQKESLDIENENLTLAVATLTKQLQAAGMVPVQTKKTVENATTTLGELTTQQLEQKVINLRADIEYMATEKEGLQKQIVDLSGVNMTPVQIRNMKTEYEQLLTDREMVRGELFKLRAEKSLWSKRQSCHQQQQVDATDNHVDHHGDIEGIPAFIDKLNRVPYFVGAQPIANDHSTVLQSLTTDLDEMRRILKHKIMFMGDSNSGKTSLIKCLTSDAPLVRSLPEGIVPTLHPIVHALEFNDPFVGKTDWHKLYVEFQDINLMASNYAREAARLHVEMVDTPGSPAFWRAVPPQFLPGKGTIYCIVYNLTHPVHISIQSIEKQLSIIHASSTRNCDSFLGGDTRHVGFCLVGTHRDKMVDSRTSEVQRHLKMVTTSLGEVIFRLRGDDDAHGLKCIGNYAVSSSDWTVIGTNNGNPANFKQLGVLLATYATRITPNAPSDFLPTRSRASLMSYVVGDGVLVDTFPESTAQMDQIQQRLRKGIVTLLTGLNREQKVRWFMKESEMRKLIAEHLDVKSDDEYGMATANYILRELSARCVIMALPSCILESKYLPRTGATPPREGIILLEPNRMLLMYSLFMTPSTVSRYAPDAEFLRDRKSVMVDPQALAKLPPTYTVGVLTEQLSASLFTRILSYTCNEPKLLFELFSVWGLGINIRSEVAMLSPAHFQNSMSAMATEYVPFLLANFGDGISRKYTLNAPCMSFFSRLQTKLIPFSHAPVNDPNANIFNYSDASFLVLEKSRLKWGTYGSHMLKDAVLGANGVPANGLIKIEGRHLYIAITARGTDSKNSLAVTRAIMDAIHCELLGLSTREFHGMQMTFEETSMTGVEEKRTKLSIGIQAILGRFQISDEAISAQLANIGDLLGDPRGLEIENALRKLSKSSTH